MSYVQASVAWCKQTLGWSNSVQSWIERGVAAGLAVAVLLLWLISGVLGTLPALVLWALLAVTGAVLLRRGWLQLFGPVLFYDMLCTARRGRYFLIRCLYCTLLLLVLFSVYSAVARSSPREESAQIAMRFFEMFTVVQLIAVVLLTPAYVAGSVAEEKDRKTLEFLLATDLRNREIILSKFGSRLGNLSLFLLTGLPILSCLQFLGGIDPDLVLGSFAATALTAIGLAAVSIANSVAYRRPRDAIAMTYLMVIAYFSVATMLYGFNEMSKSVTGGIWPLTLPIWFGATPPTVGDLVDMLNTGNILVKLIQVAEAGNRGTLATTVPTLVWHYAWFHGALCLACLVWSIARLRTIALKQSYGRTEKLRWHQGYRPAVGELPVLWKELIVDGGLQVNWAGWVAVISLVLLTLGIGLYIVADYFWNGVFNPRPWRSNLVETMNVWVRIAGTGVACLTLLGVAVRASTTIRSEMDKDTFDALITTPLSSDSILLGKFVGCLFSVRVAWIWLGSILALGVLTGGLHMFALPLMLGAWAIYAVVFAMIGLWFSMICRSSMRATVATMLTTIGLSVGHWLVWPFCCLPLMMFTGLDRGGHGPTEFLLKFQAGITPPFVLGFFAYSPIELARDGSHSDYWQLMSFSLLGLFLWSMAGLMIWFVLIGPRFRQLTRRDQSSWEAE